MRSALVCVLVAVFLAGCATRVDPLGSHLPTEPWLDGPTDPMQTLDRNLTRLLVAVPPELDGGLGYIAQPARGVFVQKLNGGALMYARYVPPAYVGTHVDPASLADRLYRRALAGRTGVKPEAVTATRVELPYGPANMLEADGSNGTNCAAFLSLMRVGKDAPEGANDAILRGSLCGTHDPKADLVQILRSLVLGE